MSKKSFNVQFKEEWCKACGICIMMCPAGVLAANIDGKAMVVAEDKCIGCLACELHCPDFCFYVKEKGENDK